MTLAYQRLKHHTFGLNLINHNDDALMATSNSAGIQLLLQAEKEAQKIVQQARLYRTQKVKDAQTEATKEIKEYRVKKEKDFKDFEAQHSGSNTQAEQAAQRDVETKLKEINGLAEKSSSKAVDELIEEVSTVKPKLHVNVHKR